MVKYMASVVKLPNGKFRAYVKGASEILLDKCRKIISDLGNGEFTDIPLTADDREMFLQVITSYASQSLRTIGVSFRDFDTWPPADAQEDLRDCRCHGRRNQRCTGIEDC